MLSKILNRLFLAITIASFFSIAAMADSFAVGFVSYDVTSITGATSGTFSFDITNLTGPNSSVFPDTSAPVTNSVSLDSLALVVNFGDGSTASFGPAYFSLQSDGLSFAGTNLPFDTSVPSSTVTGATLTGTFSTTTFLLNDGLTATVSPGFSASITDSSGMLQDQDLAVIFATGSTSGGVIPEPGTWMLLAIGILALLFSRIRFRAARRIALVVCGVIAMASVSYGAVKLNTWTNPSQGQAGTVTVWLTGSGFPAGAITPGSLTITVASTCGAAGVTAPATSVKVVIGTTDRVGFVIPGTLTPGNYFVSLAGSGFSSSNCSELTVQPSITKLAPCLPTSSLAVLQGSNVTAYVPNGCWSCGTSGVQAVPIEGAGSPASIATTNVVNSCASNSVTGTTVCTANNTDVYLINGTTLSSTLTSGATSRAGFSGGSCFNCGVAVNAQTNQAVIIMGISGSPSNSGIQFLNLGTNTFSSAIPTANEVSEDVSWDASRNLILSPNERNVYDLLQVSGGTSVAEFENRQSVSGEFDSAAEDCSTGIALSTQEFTGNLFLADLTQATFTPGSPGTWTAPSQSQNFPEFGGFSAGTSGIGVAPGSSHLGIVAGEFGGNRFGVILLPSSSGRGTPAVVDWAAASVPPAPDGTGFNFGLDPHTVTAYTSPNSNKAFGVLANSPPPKWLAIVDLQALLSAARTPGTHNVDPSINLVTAGIIRFVATH